MKVYVVMVDAYGIETTIQGPAFRDPEKAIENARELVMDHWDGEHEREVRRADPSEEERLSAQGYPIFSETYNYENDAVKVFAVELQ